MGLPIKNATLSTTLDCRDFIEFCFKTICAMQQFSDYINACYNQGHPMGKEQKWKLKGSS